MAQNSNKVVLKALDLKTEATFFLQNFQETQKTLPRFLTQHFLCLMKFLEKIK